MVAEGLVAERLVAECLVAERLVAERPGIHFNLNRGAYIHEIQSPSLLNSGNSYKEDLKIWLRKTTSKYFLFLSSIFLIFSLSAS